MTSEETTPKTDEKEEKEDKNDDTKSATIGDVKQVVRDAINEVKSLFDTSDTSTSDDDTTKEVEKESTDVAKRTRRSFSQIEHDAESLVRSQIDKVLGEVEHKKEHEALKIQKKVPEKAPIKVRRLTKFMLGKDYGNE